MVNVFLPLTVDLQVEGGALAADLITQLAVEDPVVLWLQWADSQQGHVVGKGHPWACYHRLAVLGPDGPRHQTPAGGAAEVGGAIPSQQRGA